MINSSTVICGTPWLSFVVTYRYFKLLVEQVLPKFYHESILTLNDIVILIMCDTE